jgi:hypothetical protein
MQMLKQVLMSLFGRQVCLPDCSVDWLPVMAELKPKLASLRLLVKVYLRDQPWWLSLSFCSPGSFTLQPLFACLSALFLLGFLFLADVLKGRWHETCRTRNCLSLHLHDSVCFA